MQRERLLQEVRVARQDAVPQHRIIGIAGEIEQAALKDLEERDDYSC
jgi:hypothetical protein